MPTVALKDALKNCVINFDRRIKVTDLLQRYKLSYEEVHKALEEYLRQQESEGIKYEKRFLVQGLEKDSHNEVYTVVQGEKKLQDWLQRLQQSQAALYSVEVAGGARSPACIFKPVDYHAIKLKSLRRRDTNLKPKASENSDWKAADAVKKNLDKKSPTNVNIFTKRSSAAASTSKAALEKNSNIIKETKTEKTESEKEKEKSSPEALKSNKKPSPEIKKKAVAGKKIGIGSYFSADSTGTNKPRDIKKDPSKSADSSTHMQDYFKKEVKTEKGNITATTTTATATTTLVTKENPLKRDIKVEANTSIQLFDEESSEASSDDEAKLEALKRNIISSDHEEDEETNEAEHESSSSKRRRIVDSDDDDSEKPPGKMERRGSDVIEINEGDVQEEHPQSETYLDEDGFVITIKPKKAGSKTSSASSNKIRRSPRKISPRKTSPSASAKVTAAASAAKTKQGDIKNFFRKK